MAEGIEHIKSNVNKINSKPEIKVETSKTSPIHPKNKNNKAKADFIKLVQRKAPLPATIEEIKESRTKQNELDFMKLYFEKNLEEEFSHERVKIEREICALENKFGKNKVRNFVKRTLSDWDDILKSNLDKAFSIATDARFLAGSQSVSQLFEFETNNMKKIVGEGECDFLEVLNRFEHLKCDDFA